MTEPLTINTAVALGRLLDACSRNARVTWLVPDGGGRTLTGTLRAVCVDDQGAGFWLNTDGDVRDGFVWITATFEHFLPVRDILGMMDAGEFALDLEVAV